MRTQNQEPAKPADSNKGKKKSAIALRRSPVPSRQAGGQLSYYCGAAT